jgi:phosphatidylserine/phosphatidylglycerophosphate/cardiolipin synthase-like enzyme
VRGVTGLLCAVLVVGALAGTPVSDAAVSPEIVAVYPNPVTDGDRGEFVTVRVPEGTDLSTLALDDGESVARGPNRTASGTVVLTTTPDVVRPRVDRPVYGLRGDLALANSGERLTLTVGDARDVVTYSDAPEAEVWTGNGTWRPRGATAFAPVTVRNATTRAFALPDGSDVPLDAVTEAEERLYLAGYTFESWRVAQRLVAAERRGVDVRVLVDGDPVGGVERAQQALLDRLVAAGVNVTAIDGPRARYRFHHAKYAVVDDRALVTSENWGPTGTGGGNRGWGVVVESDRLADTLSSVFHRDAGWRDGKPWPVNGTVLPGRPATESYPTRFPPVTAQADAVHLFAAPDNAERGIRSLVRSAERTLLVEQMRIEPGHPFLNATIAAARRGVRVRVLLSGAWYVREENRQVVERLERVAREEGLSLDARLAEPRSRYRVLHVKGVVVDGESVLVGSVNWNDVSVTENREIALVVEDGAVAAHFRRAFVADWRGGAWRVPAGAVAVTGALVLVAAAFLARCVRFSGESQPATRARGPRRPSSRRGHREPPPASRRRT